MGTPRHSGDDACPGVLRLLDAADGGLARVRVVGGFLTGRALSTLADAADELGDGRAELTSRGNVQLRGLAAGAGAELGARLHAAGLWPSRSHERVRNIVASPLAGLDRGRDLSGLVHALDEALCATPRLTELSGRFLFAVDDGRGDVAHLNADILIQASGNPGDANQASGNTGDANQASANPGGANPGGANPGGANPGGANPGGANPGGPNQVGADQGGGDQGGGDQIRRSQGGNEGGWNPGGRVNGLSTPNPVATAIAFAEAFLDERAAQRSDAWRIADLTDGADRVRARVAASEPATDRTGPMQPGAMRAGAMHADADQAGAMQAGVVQAGVVQAGAMQAGAAQAGAVRVDAVRVDAVGAGRVVPPPAGLVSRWDGGSALVLAVPLGRLDSGQLRWLARMIEASAARVTEAGAARVTEASAARVAGAGAARVTEASAAGVAGGAAGVVGAGAARVTPWRSIVLPDADVAVRDAAGRLGFGVSADTPWAGVSACAGRPGCAKALADVQGDARAGLGRWPGRVVHWSGCERRCGRSARTEIDVVATATGYRIEGH